MTEISYAARDVMHDVRIWVARLDDTEKMFFIIIFILLLFMLILVKSAKRPKDPSKGRSFLGSVVLIMVFAFGAGWMLDARLEIPADIQNQINSFF